MTVDLFDRIMSLHLESISVPLFDLANNTVIGECEFDCTEPVSLKERIWHYMIHIYKQKGYKVSIPMYKEEYFTLLAQNASHKLILHLVLDSEEERKAWRLSELRDRGYSLVVVRDRYEKEIDGLVGESIIDALN